MLRFLTAGESHGPSEIAILEGIPANLSISEKEIQADLQKRRGGPGRGGRGLIEKDRVKILSGIRNGKTLGSPIALAVENLDFANWKEIMSSHPSGDTKRHPSDISNPRPGHADLAGILKYGFSDVRNVLERASARETVMRVAIGAVCRKFLAEFNISITSRILKIGHETRDWEKAIRLARIKKDTLGGIIEITVKNVPPGLGSYVHWDRKLDGQISQALMSIPSVKAVEIGNGIENASLPGSQVQDEIFFSKKFYRKTNRAGGLEGGVTNGEDIFCRVYYKPISTLGNPLKSVNIKTKKEDKALIERSDICVVPRAGIISESMIAFVLSSAFLEKFGMDNMEDIKVNFKNYRDKLKNE